MNATLMRRVARQAILGTRTLKSHVELAPGDKKQSLANKIYSGVVIFAGLTTIPIWVLTHLREYRGLE